MSVVIDGEGDADVSVWALYQVPTTTILESKMLEQGPLCAHPVMATSAAMPPLPQSLMSGFRPAFRDMRSGEVRLCRTLEGALAEAHTLDHLPQEWVLECDGGGRPLQLRPEIRAGFLRGIDFWRLADLLRPALDG